MGFECERSALTKTKPCVLIDNPLTKLDRSILMRFKNTVFINKKRNREIQKEMPQVSKDCMEIMSKEVNLCF